MRNTTAYAIAALLGIGACLPLSASAGCYRCAGWEAVEDYHGSATNLPATIPEGEKFQDAISDYSATWSTDFRWTDDLAWERDFKDPSNGGTDESWADDVDLMLFAGHGNRNGFRFGVEVDDNRAHYEDAQLGDRDLEWLIVDACQVLRDDEEKWQRWGWPVFQGLHYVLGYSSNTSDVDTRGRDFVKYAMHHRWSVRNAWIRATILSENGSTAAYMRADDGASNTYDDHLWGFGYVSPDPANPTTLYYASWSTD